MKDFDRIPSKASDGNQLYHDIVTWYRSLLPPALAKSWPPPHDVDVDHNDWAQLSKSTANGFFLLLLASSWLPSLSPSAPESDIRALVEELVWSLQQMTASIKNTASGVAPTKRKARNAAGGTVKKARKA